MSSSFCSWCWLDVLWIQIFIFCVSVFVRLMGRNVYRVGGRMSSPLPPFEQERDALMVEATERFPPGIV